MTSSDIELLMDVDRQSREGLGSQIRRQLLEAIRVGRLRQGVLLPSTRALAKRLGVSRPLVVEAYAQLTAEGYLLVRQGARAVVAGDGALPASAPAEDVVLEEPIRFDLRPATPDLAMFPRKAWLGALRSALQRMPASELAYGDRRGSPHLRKVIADYLGRVRGVIADPDRMFVTSGFAEARALTAAALQSIGVRQVAVENPGYSEWAAIDKAGLERVPIPVDGDGMDIEHLLATSAEAVIVTPAHQFPIGGILSAQRRHLLVTWLREHGRFALEDDYDSEFRYDQAPIGALQGLAPEQVVYAGTVSKTLAPALRLGWLVAPLPLVEPIAGELRRWSEGPPRIDQEALAHLMESGAYDQHLRRMRRLYRQRRDILVSQIQADLPGVEIEGVAAGLHVTLRLPDGIDDVSVIADLRKRGVGLEGLGRYEQSRILPRRLFLGYGGTSETGVVAAVRALKEALAARKNQR